MNMGYEYGPLGARAGPDMYLGGAREEYLVAELARIPLDGGGSILVEAPGATSGPVKVGRVGEAISELPSKLRTMLEPVAATACTVLDELRKAKPDEVTVEFGVDLAVQAGAVITKGETSCHLKVTMSWKNDEANHDQG